MSDHALPLRFDDAHLKTGVRLRYAEQGDAEGPAVILLHGYTDSCFPTPCAAPAQHKLPRFCP